MYLIYKYLPLLSLWKYHLSWYLVGYQPATRHIEVALLRCSSWPQRNSRPWPSPTPQAWTVTMDANHLTSKTSII